MSATVEEDQHSDIMLQQPAYEHDMILSSMSCEELSPQRNLRDERQWNSAAMEPLLRKRSKQEAPDNGATVKGCTRSPKFGLSLHSNTGRNPNPSFSPTPKQMKHTHIITSPKPFPRVNSFPDDLFKQLDSSDNSDVMDDGDHRSKRKAPVSKNLVSERKRRKKLNERLYSLRAIVPNISKMDKASIVSDAITYVRELQKQVDKIQTDITGLESQREGGGAKDLRLVNAERKKARQEHQIITLDVCQMDEHIYHLRIHCKKTPGIFVQLTRALEALEIEIVNANLTSVDDHILNTVVVEVKNGWNVNTEELRNMALRTVPKFGFLFLEGLHHCALPCTTTSL